MQRKQTASKIGFSKKTEWAKSREAGSNQLDMGQVNRFGLKQSHGLDRFSIKGFRVWNTEFLTLVPLSTKNRHYPLLASPAPTLVHFQMIFFLKQNPFLKILTPNLSTSPPYFENEHRF